MHREAVPAARGRGNGAMVPAGVAGKTVQELASRMKGADIIIDGGNTYYRDDLERAKALKCLSIHSVDCGTSGEFSDLSAATV